MYIVFLSIKPSNSVSLIADCIKDAKHSIWETTLSSNPDQKSSKDAATLTKEIKKADALVVEATESNFELGRFITLALQQHKPVLMLQNENKIVPLLLGSSRLVSLETYRDDNKKEMNNLLSGFFKTVAKQRLLYRFNFMMSREMDAFVRDKAKENGMSKADYIRTLIMTDMDIN
jgi:hypothetical protein